MTHISEYILTRLNDAVAQIDIIDPTSYVAYQIYADNAYVTEVSGTQSVNVEVKPNQKIDVLGLVHGEQGTNFWWTLDDTHGNRAKLTVSPDMDFAIYFDNGTGIIDYGRAILDHTGVTSHGESLGFGLAPFGQDGFGGGVSSGGFGMLSFGSDLFGEGSGNPAVVMTHRLKSGTYRFAIVSHTAVSNAQPKIVSVTIETRPPELTPYVASYDAVNDILILAV